MSGDCKAGEMPRGEARWVDAGDATTTAPAGGEQLLVGESTLLRGSARLDAQLEPTPVSSPEPAPAAGRRLDEDEIAAAGLFQERVVEVRETREEAVIAKPVFVREEIIVRKTAEERVAQIDDTVRRTEVEVDEFAAPDMDAAPEDPPRRD
jgi:hypothetical protein